MFTKVRKLEDLLNTLSRSLINTDTKRYTANQMLSAKDINLAEGATLTINMHNTIVSLEIVNECLEVVNDLKIFLPVKGELGINKAINNYKNALTTKALEMTDNNLHKSARLLGISYRQMRYLNDKQGGNI